MHTNTRKFLSGTIVAGMMFASTVHAATNIGSGSVVGSGSLTSNVVWDDNFPGSATGAVNGLLVTATVQPTLNMVISGSGTIALGTLTSAAYSSGSVDIEVGTNAANGSSVTARSTNGGLKNTSDPTVFINDDTADEVADSYRFASAINAGEDSAYGSFAQSAALSAEVNNSSTAHTLYSSNKPQDLNGVNDLTFTVAAQPNIQTPAGAYNDVVVVTVTGNF